MKKIKDLIEYRIEEGQHITRAYGRLDCVWSNRISNPYHSERDREDSRQRCKEEIQNIMVENLYGGAHAQASVAIRELEESQYHIHPQYRPLVDKHRENIIKILAALRDPVWFPAHE